MKFGVFYLEPDRADEVDLKNLPEKCCARCFWWNKCGDELYGTCCGASTDEWAAFTYADDICEDFDLDEDE